ncbi:hypothetical protein B0H67DRAFT_143879 [Lasiosphaeris hirsuta]|uniref:Uncharacterized protein n=1 Tax=Lasiosphaeris hirsuta TaxID=260670 RepID=A0AA40E3Q0_9PEZI|nr:hypothetical protein B0H67DRAFT_143879 [Lasiosphaeris hirsuta]
MSQFDSLFLQPQKLSEGIEIVWQIGQEEVVEWACDFSVINIRLWQEDPGRETARPGKTVFQDDSTPLKTTFKWKVDTLDLDASRSNVYFFWAWNTDNATEQESVNDPSGPTGTSRFTSPKFIIAPRAQVSSSSSATGSATLVLTTSAAVTSLAPTNTAEPGTGTSADTVKIAVPVSIVAALVLGVLAWFWRRTRRRRNGSMPDLPEAASTEVKRPWDGTAVEVAADERPVEVAAESRPVKPVAQTRPVELE